MDNKKKIISIRANTKQKITGKKQWANVEKFEDMTEEKCSIRISAYKMFSQSRVLRERRHVYSKN